MWGAGIPGCAAHLRRSSDPGLEACLTPSGCGADATWARSLSFSFEELPPFTSHWVDPTGGAPSTAVLQGMANFVGLGILMATSKVSDIIDDALEVKGVGAGPALGTEALGALRRIPLIGGFLG